VVLVDCFFSRLADRFSLFVSFAGFLDSLLDRCDLDILFLLLDWGPRATMRSLAAVSQPRRVRVRCMIHALPGASPSDVFTAAPLQHRCLSASPFRAF
jgi:hypothetical protein